jgi:hypothetical protein
MIIYLKKDGTPLIEIARICGCAPCQILALNNVKSETELLSLEKIKVPAVTEHLIVRN